MMILNHLTEALVCFLRQWQRWGSGHLSEQSVQFCRSISGQVWDLRQECGSVTGFPCFHFNPSLTIMSGTVNPKTA